jgi:outer membrane protein assembly factor BamB
MLLPLLLLLFSGPKDWPGWRGPDSNGVSQLRNIPLEWSAQKNIAWRSTVEGRGHSSPVVWANRVFLTTDIEGEVIPGHGPVKHVIGGQPFLHPDSTGGNKRHTLKVICFDAESGKLLWSRAAYEGSVYDDVIKFSNYAAPTPVSDGHAVYAWFESQGLYKYDFEGRQLWKTSFGGISTHGAGPGTSPVLYNDLILLLCDQDNGEASFLAAVSAKDGKIVWKTKRTARVTWTTPLLVQSGGRPQLIVAGSEQVIAYDPRTGKELWSAEGFDGNSVHTPLAGHGMVFVTTGYPNRRTLAYRLQPQPGEPRLAWKYEKGTSYIPSPILVGDYLYLMTNSGMLTCLDARTGVVKYEGKRVPVAVQFTASPVGVEGKILLSSHDGDTFVIQAGPEHEVVRTNPLGEPIYASLAVADDSVYVRTDKALYRIRSAGR